MNSPVSALMLLSSLIVSSAAFASPHRVVLDCDVADAEAGLESLVVIQGVGHLSVSVEVSGPGDFMEGYHYVVQPVRDTAGKLLSLQGPRFKLELGRASGKTVAARLWAVGPEHSQLHPGGRFSYSLSCKRPGV